MGYEVGSKVRLNTEVRNPAGTLTNATMSVVIQREDGTNYVGPFTPVNDSTGIYHVDFTPDTPGQHRWVWTATGAVEGVYRGQSYVRTPFAGIMSLQEAKEQLNKRADDTTDDDELLDWIDAITLSLEKLVGAIVPRSYTEKHNGSDPPRPPFVNLGSGMRSRIFLRERPVLSITQVKEDWGYGDTRTLTGEAYGGPYNENDYVVDLETGSLIRRNSGSGAYWPRGVQNVEVTYMAGRTPIPPNLRQAAKELLTHHWRASQLSSGATRPRTDVPADTAAMGIAIPNRVNLLIGWKRGPRLG